MHAACHAVRVGLLKYFTDWNFKLTIKTKKIQDPCALSFSEQKKNSTFVFRT